MITPGQIRGARAMLNMKQADLAKAADISAAALNSIERGKAIPRTSTWVSIRRALEEAGVEFIPENGGGAGVRLRNADHTHSREPPTGDPKGALADIQTLVRVALRSSDPVVVRRDLELILTITEEALKVKAGQ
jgi:DNA-binding XRE family transcriptional regulator